MSRIGLRFKKCLPVFLATLFLLLQPASVLAEEQYLSDNAIRVDPLQSVKQRGQIQVGEFTGAAIYEYPIKVPAGRNGLTPSVAITYNSQDEARDNILGFHWSINQYSITHLNKKGVDKIYSREDFIADTPFSSGELVKISTRNFAEKVESSFARYELQSDNSWLVTDKAGNQYLFGNSEDTRQFDPSNTNYISRWMLEEIRDPNDNFIRYEYEKIDNQIYPKKIIYTGNGTEDGIFEIHFLRGDSVRSDNHFSYANGFLVETKYLVNGIETYVDGHLRSKYELGYLNIAPILRNTLANISETSYSEDGSVTVLPPTTFEYTPSIISWQQSSLYESPVPLVTEFRELGHGSTFTQHQQGFFWDFSGDGLVDLTKYNQSNSEDFFINDGKGGWIPTDQQIYNTYLGKVPDLTVKPTDFDGDTKMDFLSSYINPYNYPETLDSSIRFGNGGNINNVLPIAMGKQTDDWGVSVADLNGDGLPDMLGKMETFNDEAEYTYEKGVCLNENGNNCVSTNLWEAPVATAVIDNMGYQLQRQTYLQDCNMDGLADFYSSHGGYFINNGKGGWTSLQGAQVCPQVSLDGVFYRSVDLNGDGLIDRVHSYYEVTNGAYDIPKNYLYLDTGRGMTGDIGDFPVYLGHGNGTGWNGTDMEGIRIMDLNGDLLPDILQSHTYRQDNGNRPTTFVYTKNVWLHTGSRPYYLKKVNTSTGGTIDLEYKTSAQYMKEDGTQANPNLPIITTTVSRIRTTDGIGNANRVDYFYEDGHFYFQNSYDRGFAGFRVVTKTDSQGYKVKNYYHQSQYSVADSASGEYLDHISKKGKLYRSENYSNNGNLITVNINKIDYRSLGANHDFPYISQSLSQTIDGGVVRSTAKSFVYDNYGNQTEVTDYGEVTATSSGDFTDIGNDLLKTTITYIRDNGKNMVSYPSEKIVMNQSNEILTQSKTYYDGLSFGVIDKGNVTAQEEWLDTNNSWLRSETKYNEYGLPVSVINPRGYSTNTEYDTNSLYPLHTTNAKGQTVETIYDLGTGQITSKIDSNGSVTATEYDGLGRMLQIERDGYLLTSAAYNDRSNPRSIFIRNHNDDGETVDQYTYLDALDRTIETKTESSGGKWVTTQTIYNQRGNIYKQIQPYFSDSSDFESLSASKTGNKFTYDGLDRVISIQNPLGTTYTDYAGWEITTTDPEGHKKTITKDARGNLIRVDEKNEGAIYQTYYTYNPLGQLMSIQDAQNNVRNFDYDSLGRRKFQTKLGSDDKWRYKYDENSNLIQKTDPKNQIINYSYDELDRVLTEDFQGQDGIELNYQYDTGSNAIGRLDRIYTSDYEHAFTYDLWGRVIQDKKNIQGEIFIFNYIYDQLGAVTSMTYPDGAVVGYDYDSSHQLRGVKVGLEYFAENFQYAPTGQVTEMTLGNGIVVTNQYDPDQMYRMTAKTTTGNLQNYSYAYDSIGNLIKLIDLNNGTTAKTVDYEYDDLSRLLVADYTDTASQTDITQTYTYDAVGNMIFKSDIGIMSYGNNHPHAVDTAGEHNYTYDDNGNMVMRDETQMIYDYKDRLIESSGEASFTYGEAYDRLTKTNLLTSDTTYYPEKYFERSNSEEVKYVYAGDMMLGKIVKTIAASSDQTPDPQEPPSQDPEDPQEPQSPQDPQEDNSSSQGSTPPSPPQFQPPTSIVPISRSSGGSGSGGGNYSSQKRIQLMNLINEGHIQQAQKLATQLSDYRLSAITKEALKKRDEEGELPSHSFNNLKIKYKKDSAIITWDAIPEKIASFNIYRSKGKAASPGEDPKVFLGNIPANSTKNRFVHDHKEGYAKYSYKIEALSEKGSVLLTSITLHSNQVFMYEGQSKIVDFRNFSDTNFTHVKIYSNEYVDGEETRVPQRLILYPDEALENGARIKVRFLDCDKKKDGSKYCTNLDVRYIDVYVIEKERPLNNIMAFLGGQTKRMMAAFVPNAYAEESESTEKIYYFLTDHLGSIDAVLNEDGNVVERQDYLPYGMERASEGEDTNTDRGFTGKELDEETNLHYYTARYYDSEIGRFISIDPLVLDEAKKTKENIITIIDNPQKLNNYSYVLNNPIILIDTFGESAESMAGFGRMIDGGLKIIAGYASGMIHPSTKLASVAMVISATSQINSGFILATTEKEPKELSGSAKTMMSGINFLGIGKGNVAKKFVLNKAIKSGAFERSLREIGELAESTGKKFGNAIRKMFNEDNIEKKVNSKKISTKNKSNEKE
jgi:RHS repeat-associated protein